MNEKNVKITKQTHAFRGYASSDSVEILNSFNPELQLKDNESAIKNKLKNMLTELKRFKFEVKLVLVLKKIESEEKKNMTPFIHTQNQEQLLMKVT